MSALQNIIEMVEVAHKKQLQINAGGKMPRNLSQRWVNVEWLLTWIEKSNLIPELFEGGTHVELIKRSSTILHFITIYSNFDEKYLDAMEGHQQWV